MLLHCETRNDLLARGCLLLLTYASQNVKHYSGGDTVRAPMTQGRAQIPQSGLIKECHDVQKAGQECKTRADQL